MFIHKYRVEGESFYRLSSKSRPTDTVRLSPSNHIERIPASRVNNYLSSIEKTFKDTPEEEKKPKEEEETVEKEEKKEKEEAPKKEKKKKKASIVDFIRIVASVTATDKDLNEDK